MMELCEDTGNVYETVAIIGKRANQIAVEMKNDLSKKLQEFASYSDNLEEVFENREQIEISRYYEKPSEADSDRYSGIHRRKGVLQKPGQGKGKTAISRNYDTAHSDRLSAGCSHSGSSNDLTAGRKFRYAGLSHE